MSHLPRSYKKWEVYAMAKIALFDHKKFSNAISKANLKQEQLAERLDISARHIRNLKSEDTSVSASLLYKVSIEFQKPMEYFLTIQEEDETVE